MSGKGLTQKLKYIGSTCHELLSVKQFGPQSRQNGRPDLGLNCLKGLSADDNVM